MLRSIRLRLTYANVISTLALFIALGGTTYAITTIGSSDIRNNSVRSVDLRNNDVRGRDVRRRSLSGSDIGENRLGGGAIRESALGKVPTAADADRVGGFTGAQLKVSCPAFTSPVAGVCVEGVASAPATYSVATFQCRDRGRRAAPYVVLREFFRSTGTSPALGGEWTADVFESRTTAGQLDTVVITTTSGGSSFETVFTPAVKAFRCMANAGN